MVTPHREAGRCIEPEGCKTVAAQRLAKRIFHTTGRERMEAPSRKTEGVLAVAEPAAT